MATQTALIVHKIGEPVIAVSDWPIPQPGSKQVQIRVTTAGLNPHDRKGRDFGLFIQDDFPAILGSDIVGIVTMRGEGATRFNIGDRIFGQASMAAGSISKALQEYAVVDEDFAAVVPAGFEDDECATFPTNLLAGKLSRELTLLVDVNGFPGVIGFFDEQGLGLSPPWQTESTKYGSSSILIVGGGSNCGRFATQLSKLIGFGTIVVVGGHLDELTSFGATHVVDRHGDHDAVLHNIRAIVGDELLYAFDTYNNPPDQNLAINALSRSKRGKMARLTYSREYINERMIHPKEAGYELKNVVGLSHLKPDIAIPFWRHVAEYLVQGQIEPLGYVVYHGLDPDIVNGVLDRYRDGKAVVQTHLRVGK
jgi:NADPH2:quinone reductase